MNVDYITNPNCVVCRSKRPSVSVAAMYKSFVRGRYEASAVSLKDTTFGGFHGTSNPASLSPSSENQVRVEEFGNPFLC